MRESITTPLKRQQGMTLISWLVIIVFLLFQIVLAMNVLPVYLTDSSVGNIMAALPDDPKAQNLTHNEIKALVAKRLSVNSIYTVTAKDITVKKGRGLNVVTIAYEPRGKLIGNLDYIVNFKHEARVAAR